MPESAPESSSPQKPTYKIDNIAIFIGEKTGAVVPTGEKGIEANEAERIYSDAEINAGKFRGAAYHPMLIGVPLNSLDYNEVTGRWRPQSVRFSEGIGGWGEPLRLSPGIKEYEKIGDGQPHCEQELLVKGLDRWKSWPGTGEARIPEPKPTEQENIENGS